MTDAPTETSTGPSTDALVEAARSVRLRPEIVALPAYKQGKPAAADAFKLSSNENPFPPHPAVLATIRDLDINRYPDASALAVRERLAARHGVTTDEVVVGAGSVSVLSQLISAAAGTGDEVVHAWRSFEAYPGLVTVAGALGVRVPLTEDARHDLPAMRDAITDRTRVLIICSPNNPTGTVVGAEEFAELMAAVPPSLLVVLDEAYAEFVRDSSAVDGAALLRRYPNLVVLRTFSKAYGLAGLRVGYGIGPAPILDAARSVAIPLSVTEAAQRAVLAALDVEDELLENVGVLAERCARVQEALREQGWAVPVSQGNFVWLPTGDGTSRIADALGAAGLVVRAFPPEGIRVSIGEEESVATLLRICGEVVGTL